MFTVARVHKFAIWLLREGMYGPFPLLCYTPTRGVLNGGSVMIEFNQVCAIWV
jgi:hypothetical protein